MSRSCKAANVRFWRLADTRGQGASHQSGIKMWKERDAFSGRLKTYSLTVSWFIL